MTDKKMDSILNLLFVEIYLHFQTTYLIRVSGLFVKIREIPTENATEEFLVKHYISVAELQVKKD